MALATVQEYVNAARTLLQDATAPFRYPDADILEALNQGLLDARRVRPDLFIRRPVPSYAAVNATAVVFDDQFRTVLLDYVVGRVQLRDDEETQDTRAAGLMTRFIVALGGRA